MRHQSWVRLGSLRRSPCPHSAPPRWKLSIASCAQVPNSFGRWIHNKVQPVSQPTRGLSARFWRPTFHREFAGFPFGMAHFFWENRLAGIAPSCSSNARFLSRPYANPRNSPALPTTRWQGITNANGLAPVAAPTAWEPPRPNPKVVDNSAYVVVCRVESP